jgi:chemotaxis protein MotB
MKKIVIALSVLALLTSCVSKKKYTDLEARNKETQDLLNTATVKLNACLEEKAGLSATASLLKEQNQGLISTSKDMTILSTKGAENIEKALESIKEKGSYDVTDKAKGVLAKVAKVVNDKPDFECMVEGHTDNVPYNGSGILLDNWDLSVKRSTSIIRVLTTQLGVKPEQLIAAGRSSYIPLVANDSAENRARNRRTRIVVLPKIDQFYEMIEKEMKKQRP